MPRGLSGAAAVSWRVLVVAAAVGLAGYVLTYLAAVAMPVVIALLLAALLGPFSNWLTGKGAPRALATALVVCVGLISVTGVLALVVGTVVADLPRLQAQVSNTLESGEAWLRLGPLRLDQRQLDELVNDATATLQTHQGGIISGVLSTAVTSGEVLGGALLVLFTLIFFLYDGDRIWNFLLRGFPLGSRDRVDLAGRSGFDALTGYVRATAAVACMDAIGVGVSAALIGVPLAPALAALVFLGAFVPYLGILITGTLAVLVCLVTVGFWPAVLMAAIVIVVTQLEGHVLQPLLLGRASHLHPLAVVLSISVGFVLAGVAGAVVAVPVLAVSAAAVRSLSEPEGRRDRGTEEEEAHGGEGHGGEGHGGADRAGEQAESPKPPPPGR
ncbi:AI-2E family transporter [Saccharopolyspora erythraea]|uniref:Integral membrane protein n=2 Tax=Saccharopolyspora erythraea TaxID=1836 RepID=A4FL49_SACEN|nr:AI-2E family transporter [Saccharopolyspora erythraea]QRK88482.1 AI-2E family transporter [Saccharopolyspora erythraea]CAM04774.1 integral membrane protein [Saccharopolyspora erythraea NRRL 2338]